MDTEKAEYESCTNEQPVYASLALILGNLLKHSSTKQEAFDRILALLGRVNKDEKFKIKKYFEDMDIGVKINAENDIVKSKVFLDSLQSY